MGRFIKRKNLTSEQYWMANKTMSVILMVCYLIYAIIEISNNHTDTFSKVRIGIYLLFGIGNFFNLHNGALLKHLNLHPKLWKSPLELF